MELLKCSKDQLLNPLSIVSGIVERRHTLPVLANVLIKKNNQNITFTSTDIEIQIKTRLGSNIQSNQNSGGKK